MAILVAIGEENESNRAISVAYDLATTYDDRFVALHVVPNEDFQSHRESIRDIPGFGDFSISQEADGASRFAQRAVQETLDSIEYERVSMRGRVGDPAKEILAEADALDPRFLVIGGSRRSPVGKALFGSTTQEILLESDWPVVTTMTERPEE